VQIIERPSPKQDLKLSTSIETKIENKLHQDGGGGGHGPAPAPPPAKTKNPRQSLQTIAEAVYGIPLEPIHEHYLNGAPYKFSDPMALPADYRVRLGDHISILAWGQVDIDYTTAVDLQGNFYVPRVGKIPVFNATHAELSERIKRALEKQYRNFELLIRIGAHRSSNIHVTGFAKRPGTIQLEPHATFYQAILLSMGPSATGSARKIELRRAGKVVTTADLYDILFRGELNKDIPIYTGDVIHYPAQSGLVAIGGQVKQGGLVEITESSNLAEIVRLVGGFANIAKLSEVIIERNYGEESRQLLKVELSDRWQDFQVQNGDVIQVYPRSYRVQKSVTVKGHVALPIRKVYWSGMRVSDVITKVEDLIHPQYWLSKNRADNELLTAAKETPNIRNNFPEINWDYASIERLDQAEMRTAIIPFNLKNAIQTPNSPDNMLLAEDDVITVFSKDDMRLPTRARSKWVKIEGEVVRAGFYTMNHDDTIHDLLRKAGGPTTDAYLFGAELVRDSVRRTQQQRFNEFVDRLDRDFLRYNAGRARNAASQEDALAVPAESENLKALIQRLRGIAISGRLLLNVPVAARDAEQLPKLNLEDNDALYIPAKSNMVHVIGAVTNQGTYAYSETKGFNDYLVMAGGPSRYADTAGVYVLRADGSVRLLSSSWLFARYEDIPVLPGDTFIIPERPEQISWTKSLKDWTQILYQFGLGLAGLKILSGL
jgi:protein involved in polysaccharide export with SLBB domain